MTPHHAITDLASARTDCRRRSYSHSHACRRLSRSKLPDGALERPRSVLARKLPVGYRHVVGRWFGMSPRLNAQPIDLSDGEHTGSRWYRKRKR